MLKFRVDRRVRLCDSDMNGKENTTDGKNSHTKSAITVSNPSPAEQTYSRMSRTPRKAATFGKRSNSMRRNPTADVTKKGWLYKQASSGVKQWNRRWFVLADRCLFYYKDEKEDTVLGSLPLLSFQIGAVELSDNITRKFAFKVRLEEGEDELKGPVVFCMQAGHAGTRTYYFSTDSHEEQEEWIKAMSDAAEVKHQLTQRPKTDTANVNHTMVTNEQNPQTHTQTNNETDSTMPPHSDMNDVHSLETPPASTPTFEQDRTKKEGKQGGGGKGVEDKGEEGHLGLDPTLDPNHYSNGWSSYDPPSTMPHNSNSKGPQSQSYSGHRGGNRESEIRPEPSRDSMERQENVTLRRGFVPRTAPEKVAQRKSSMAQLQQWVNQRRAIASQEDISSPSTYFPVNRGVSADFYAYSGAPPYMNEYPLYSPGIRPDSICSVSAVGGYDRTWTVEEKRRSLRDGPPHLYGPQMQRDPWGPPYYSGMEMSMRHLSIQPRSRSVPRSPSSSSGGPYSPVPHSFASPARSPSSRFDRFPGRVREDLIYADPSVYSLRRSLSSPRYDLPGERRSVSQGLRHNSYPVSPSIHSKMEDIIDLQLQRNLDYLDQQVPPFYDNRELHPTLKLNEIETSKLLGRLCEQNQILKDHEAVVHRLRMDKDSLEEALVSTHQEMELYHNQPLVIEKLQFKKEAQQNQLINIRGELSQASSALTTTRMEFEALEDEANAIHGDLWEQLNTGGQSDLVQRHIQKEFWRVQDVLEGLHKNNSSRGTDTAKHRVASGASGSFSTNSSASPLSSVSLTSPLSPFSSVPGCQSSPTKQLGLEENVPPRPPLPKSYYPLEPSPTFLPSLPPLPIDSTAWLHGLGIDGYLDGEDTHIRKAMFGEQNSTGDMQEQVQDRQSSTNKVGIVPPRTKSPTCEIYRSSAGVSQRNGRLQNGAARERPKSAVFPAEIKSKMSIEEQNERIRRNQSNSVRDKRRSLNLSSGQTPANYRVVRRRLTAHEIDIKDLEVAVRGQGHESPQEEIARLRRLHVEPERYDMSTELIAPDKVVIPGRYLDVEEDVRMSPEDQREKQKKLERIKTLIAKSNLQNIVPLLDGPVEDGASSSSLKQLQEQEKRIEISCALAAEASRRSRLLSAQCSSSPSISPTGLVPTPSSSDFPNAASIMKV